MNRNRLCGTAMVAVLVAIGVSSVAQAQDSSVLMRRPLDMRTGSTGTPSSTPAPTPGSTPAPTPGGTPPQTPTPPDTPTPSETPSSGQTNYFLEYGPWVGAAACGEDSSLTRDVSCYGEIYDADGNYVDYEYFPVSTCVASGLPDPVASYTGKGAGCGYYSDVTYEDWDQTCSWTAKRKMNIVCHRSSDDAIVDKSFCTQQLETGGQEWYSDGYQHGNTDGCGTKWVATQGDPVCKEAVAFADTTYECQKSDPSGRWGYADESECTGPKPVAQAGDSIGTCEKWFDRDDRGYCTGSVLAVKTLAGSGDTFYGGNGRTTNTFCVQSGATCCQERQGYDANYTWQAVAMDGVADGKSRDHSVKADNSRWTPGDPNPRYDVYNARVHYTWRYVAP